MAITIPSVLAFNRKIDTSDALMFSHSWGETALRQVRIHEKTVRGVVSHARTTKDDVKWEHSVTSPNIATVDEASLPAEHDTLRVSFTLRIHGKVGVPSACNDPAVTSRLQEMLPEYMEDDAILGDLATRYAQNVANARWLWRNGVDAEDVVVTVEKVLRGAVVKDWTFDALKIMPDTFRNPLADVVTLGADFADAFKNGGFHFYRVNASVRVGAGQQVYPSQLLAAHRDERGGKAKVLFQIQDQAAMSSQKIGNALRTVDTWYDDNVEYPIAVEVYGAVTTMAKAWRSKTTDFFTLFKKALLAKDLSVTDKQYILAILIRGGVFGAKDK